MKLYRKQEYQCGNYLEVNMFPVFTYLHTSNGTRKKKRKPTSKVQERLNQINAERELVRLINANFTNKDLKFELTYSPYNYPDSIEAAQKDIVNFLRRIKRYRKKYGLSEMKYVYSIEQGSKKRRLHFHVVMTGGIDITTIAKIWGKGYVDRVCPLLFSQTGCTGIGKYFCKQKITGKRWVSSRNCIKPVAKNTDGKISKRKIKELSEECENRRMFEALYPDYFYAVCKPFYNDINGEYYLSLFMYKRKSEIDVFQSDDKLGEIT